MSLKPELADEISVLLHFNLDTTQEGIKVHHSADPSMITATERLFEKGLITRNDGGYLTDLGHDATEHAQALLTILTTI